MRYVPCVLCCVLMMMVSDSPRFASYTAFYRNEMPWRLLADVINGVSYIPVGGKCGGQSTGR